jgi:serine/threonine protein phosphatase PrpC
MKLKFEILSTTLIGVKPDRIPNQDCLRVEENSNFLVATISDGLGSACKSHIGAQIACDVVVNYFKTNKELKREQINDNIIAEWERRIKSKPLENKNYFTTNSFVVVLKNDKKIIVGRIGDVLVSVKIDGMVCPINMSEKDFLNETEAMGGKNQKYSIEVFDYSENVDFLIASDGIGDEILLERMDELFDYFKNKYREINKKHRHYIFKDEIKNTFFEKNADDKTIIFVWAK